MKLHDLPVIDRPREKLARYGVNKLSNAELLAMLLGTGKRGVSVLMLAQQLLKRFGPDLPKVEINQLEAIDGLGQAKASMLVASFELSRRLLEHKQSELRLSPQDVWNALPDIRDSRKEHFVVFFLNSRHQQIERSVISVGTLNANLIHPREVFELAIIHTAAQLIIAHNHPSGDSEPSTDDIAVTKRLVKAGELLGIAVIDHVIATKVGYYSFSEHELVIAPAVDRG